MSAVFSLDEYVLTDRKSTFVIRVTGKRKRLGLFPGDFLVIDRNLPHQGDKIALLVRRGKFCLDVVTEDILAGHDPENGDFIWGMVKAIVRELP